MDHGQVSVSHLRVATEHQRFVRVAHRWQPVIALPAIRPYDRPFRDVLFHERRQAIGVTYWPRGAAAAVPRTSFA